MSSAEPSNPGGTGERGAPDVGARGCVRDALGSLRNLERLLQSIKVGPRALSSVIPAVHASCGPLLGAVRQLLEGLTPLGAAPAAVEAYVTPRVVALEKALERAGSAPLNARRRLELESAVARAVAELETGCALVELLERAHTGTGTFVSLLEVARSTHRVPDGASSSGYEQFSVTVVARPAPDVLVDPRVAAELVAIAVRRVASTPGAGRPHLEIGPTGNARVSIRVSPGPAEGEPLVILAPRLIEPTLAAALAAARACGGDFVVGEDGGIALEWPASAGE
jgi:hypothetical protein